MMDSYLFDYEEEEMELSKLRNQSFEMPKDMQPSKKQKRMHYQEKISRTYKKSRTTKDPISQMQSHSKLLQKKLDESKKFIN